MNNSQSTEIIKRYYKVIVGCELSADQRRAAQLADGLIPPKTTFFSNNREINPEFAGYGVLPCSQVREVVQSVTGIDQGRLFPTSALEREQPDLAANACRSEAFRRLQPKTAPAKEAAAKGAWEAGKRGMSLALASRRPTRCRFASARGAQNKKVAPSATIRWFWFLRSKAGRVSRRCLRR